MLRLFQATAVFFKILGNRRYSAQIKALKAATHQDPPPAVEEKVIEKIVEKVVEVPATVPEYLASIDALTFVRALQREARLVDFLMEDIAPFSDEQVGAAVRDIHGKSKEVLQHFFDIVPLANENEGTQIEVPTGYDPGKYTLMGAVSGNGPWKGAVQHPGWIAQKAEVPTYTGTQEAARVLSPTEVEVVA